MMKAIIITKPGEPAVLQLNERPIPKPGVGEVLINVKAAGVNRPDVAQRQGRYPPPPGAPVDIPGLEIAGVIEQCGENVERWKIGDKVCALVVGGGYASYVVANAGHCLPLPKDLDFVETASLPETVFTVWHNVFRLGKLKAGEHLLVHGGSSGIGITAIQLAKAAGARVFITAGSADKCDACAKLGADICINYKEQDFEQILEPEGVDVVLDMVGGDYIDKNLRLLRVDGRMVFINTMKGSKGSFDAYDLMRRRLTITGSTLRNRENSFKTELAAEVEKHVWPWIEAGKFKPVIYKTFPLANAADAHQLMESSEHIGKIVLVNA
jgi:NADPH2:quinone reductase